MDARRRLGEGEGDVVVGVKGVNRYSKVDVAPFGEFFQIGRNRCANRITIAQRVQCISEPNIYNDAFIAVVVGLLGRDS